MYGDFPTVPVRAPYRVKDAERFSAVLQPYDDGVRTDAEHGGVDDGHLDRDMGASNRGDVVELALEVRVPLDRIDIPLVGDVRRLTVDGVSSRQYLVGIIERIEAEPALRSTTATIRLRVSDNDGLLRPGMMATVSLPVHLARGALAIPQSAVYWTGQKDIVWVPTGPHTWAPRAIKAGRTVGGYVEVLGGLADVDFVVSQAGLMIDPETLPEAASDSSHVTPRRAQAARSVSSKP